MASNTLLPGLAIADDTVDGWECSCDRSVDAALSFSYHLHLLFSACSVPDILILLVVDMVKPVSQLSHN